MASGLYWASAVLAVIIGVFALDIMGLFSWKNHLDVDGKVWHCATEIEWREADIEVQTVLLTGGSSGMGRGVAKILAQKGANIVIVARNQERLADALSYVSVSLTYMRPLRLNYAKRSAGCCQKPFQAAFYNHLCRCKPP
jgi:3-dehydrosphinganine reductase